MRPTLAAAPALALRAACSEASKNARLFLRLVSEVHRAYDGANGCSVGSSPRHAQPPAATHAQCIRWRYTRTHAAAYGCSRTSRRTTSSYARHGMQRTSTAAAAAAIAAHAADRSERPGSRAHVRGSCLVSVVKAAGRVAPAPRAAGGSATISSSSIRMGGCKHAPAG